MANMKKSNFLAYLTNEEGGIVPGSIRRGHNIFTRFGQLWLRGLTSWHYPVIFSSSDIYVDNRRLRWIGVGTGSMLEDVNIVGLVSPALIQPSAYLKTLPIPTRPDDVCIRYTTTFSGSDFASFGPSITVSEAGLFVDVDVGLGPGLDPSVASHVPVSYKRFDPPLTKALAQTLTIVWEYRY